MPSGHGLEKGGQDPKANGFIATPTIPADSNVRGVARFQNIDKPVSNTWKIEVRILFQSCYIPIPPLLLLPLAFVIVSTTLLDLSIIVLHIVYTN